MIQGVFGLMALLLFTGCTQMLFHPDSERYALPQEYNLTYDTVSFRSADGTLLDGWRLHPPGKVKGSVLLVHGNAQNMSAHFTAWVWLVKAGYELFVFDYRGYGRSKGKPELEGAVRDTEAALAYLCARSEGDVVAIGQSLGGVLLLNALSRGNASKVSLAVIDSAYGSLPEQGREVLSRSIVMWPLQWTAYLLLDDAYDPIGIVPKLTVPKLYVAGGRDGIISPNRSWQLFEASAKPKAFWLVSGAEHIRAFESPALQRAFLRFLEAPDYDPDRSAMLIFDTIP